MKPMFCSHAQVHQFVFCFAQVNRVKVDFCREKLPLFQHRELSLTLMFLINEGGRLLYFSVPDPPAH